MHNEIIIKGALENNLKNIDVSIPKNKLVVLTGLSGSGKSSLAYDTLQKECQRQYMESMGMVTDLISKPKVLSISGLSPSISVDQHHTNRSPRSTMGTATEVYTYLRILFAKIGKRDCPHCGRMVSPPMDAEYDTETLGFDEEVGEDTFPCPFCGGAVSQLSMTHFSFNKPQGACEMCTGLGTIYEADWDSLIDDEKSIVDGAVREWDIHYINRNRETFAAAACHYGFDFNIHKPVKFLSKIEKNLLFYGVNHDIFKKHFPDIEPPETASKGRFEGVSSNILRRYAEHTGNSDYQQKIEKSLIKIVCPSCNGSRLKVYSTKVTVADTNIVEVSKMPLSVLADWVASLEAGLSIAEKTVAEPVINDLVERIGRLVEAGIGYLTIDRGITTLSGGEAQRLRLAALLGSGLTGVLYILDEPTTGLHSRDTNRLISVLNKLRDMGNTILVIEHDMEVMLKSDYIIDMGPGAGVDGGKIIGAGTPEELMEQPDSITGRCLKESMQNKTGKKTLVPKDHIIIKGAAEYNLKSIDVSIPLGALTAITGVSGSGKSTLIFDVLSNELDFRLNKTTFAPNKCHNMIGSEKIDRVITVDQTPIGRGSRSNAATYIDIFTPIRNLYASLPEAIVGKLTARDFSFNVPGGRCDRCEGAGVLTVEMHFLPDIEMTCPGCKGKRFKKHTLSVNYMGSNISDVLDMSVQEAYELFRDKESISSRLKILVELGMGYLKLGQSATTLSGGEAQRVKLSKELSKKKKGNTLYLLDEPTTGLHPEDTKRLKRLLHRLVDSGNTVIAVEHNLDLISDCDWIIDLGPEGGEQGGKVIAQGTPEDVMKIFASYTGRCLADAYNPRRN
ncbi:excinuclease ABC subunit UvrA [Candidatus Contubernalis alkaliaceticus]|uniref:excinuclease ABC subunit UvrA n=1 Tax=Candidatus Contubernalis alkaliaceticus TaxID=338645 RepID=UPI001F4C50BF|nr:excinuclease ABC subunit UvrA [Candidatus Contubernalis alkalaceticus]UNC92321.1 excinuclease ABC subunit UvrA [Candidatus Contubernalis alkalaceticus]